MLVLKRRVDQAVKIGPDVTVKIIRIEHGAVILGITAPASSSIGREDPLSDGADITYAEPTQDR